MIRTGGWRAGVLAGVVAGGIAAASLLGTGIAGASPSAAPAAGAVEGVALPTRDGNRGHFPGNFEDVHNFEDIHGLGKLEDNGERGHWPGSAGPLAPRPGSRTALVCAAGLCFNDQATAAWAHRPGASALICNDGVCFRDGNAEPAGPVRSVPAFLCEPLGICVVPALLCETLGVCVDL